MPEEVQNPIKLRPVGSYFWPGLVSANPVTRNCRNC